MRGGMQQGRGLTLAERTGMKMPKPMKRQHAEAWIAPPGEPDQQPLHGIVLGWTKDDDGAWLATVRISNAPPSS